MMMPYFRLITLLIIRIVTDYVRDNVGITKKFIFIVFAGETAVFLLNFLSLIVTS